GPAEILVSRLGIITGAFGHSIQTAHPVCIQSAGQGAQRLWQARVGVESVKKNGLVLWEKVAIVSQEDQIILNDFWIGGIGVGEINLAFVQSHVGKRVLQGSNPIQ